MLKVLVKRRSGYLDRAITASARNIVRVQANGSPVTLKNLMTVQKEEGRMNVAFAMKSVTHSVMRERGEKKRK